jgi:hypothetical protein
MRSSGALRFEMLLMSNIATQTKRTGVAPVRDELISTLIF